MEVERLNKFLLERELRGDAAGSYRSRALEEAIEEERLNIFPLERKLRGDAVRSDSSDFE